MSLSSDDDGNTCTRAINIYAASGYRIVSNFWGFLLSRCPNHRYRDTICLECTAVVPRDIQHHSHKGDVVGLVWGSANGWERFHATKEPSSQFKSRSMNFCRETYHPSICFSKVHRHLQQRALHYHSPQRNHLHRTQAIRPLRMGSLLLRWTTQRHHLQRGGRIQRRYLQVCRAFHTNVN